MDLSTALAIANILIAVLIAVVFYTAGHRAGYTKGQNDLSKQVVERLDEMNTNHREDF